MGSLYDEEVQPLQEQVQTLGGRADRHRSDLNDLDARLATQREDLDLADRTSRSALGLAEDNAQRVVGKAGKADLDELAAGLRGTMAALVQDQATAEARLNAVDELASWTATQVQGHARPVDVQADDEDAEDVQRGSLWEVVEQLLEQVESLRTEVAELKKAAAAVPQQTAPVSAAGSRAASWRRPRPPPEASRRPGPLLPGPGQPAGGGRPRGAHRPR